MKHPTQITVMLVALFIAAQVTGLLLLALDIKDISGTQGALTVEHGSTAIGDRPTTHGFDSFLYLVLGVAIGTALVLVLIRFKAYTIWKVWFLIAIWFSTTIAIGVVLPATAAFIICLGLAVWKVYWPNPIIHNLAEIFMYAGLAVLLVPIFSIGWVIILLLVVSVYDMIAVWYSKHMVVMAQAQTKSNLFAGLYIPKDGGSKGVAAPVIAAKIKEHEPHGLKELPAELPGVPPPSGTSAAILGGGDIAFPLIFSGVVLDWRIAHGIGVQAAVWQSTIITACAALALALLFIYAKKDKFYPAMPFITAGCLLGLGIVALL